MRTFTLLLAFATRVAVGQYAQGGGGAYEAELRRRQAEYAQQQALRQQQQAYAQQQQGYRQQAQSQGYTQQQAQALRAQQQQRAYQEQLLQQQMMEAAMRKQQAQQQRGGDMPPTNRCAAREDGRRADARAHGPFARLTRARVPVAAR